MKISSAKVLFSLEKLEIRTEREQTFCIFNTIALKKLHQHS